MAQSTNSANVPLTGRSLWIVTVSSMEQIIGAALTTVVGVILPMLKLVMHPGLSPMMQGIVGAIGLVGIAIGSIIIGKLSDRYGYLWLFRMCPVLVIVGAAIGWLLPDVTWLIISLFLAGIGVGGGYSLDSAYISELLPERWRAVMVGVAKATCAIGFIGAAAICWVLLRCDPAPGLWSDMMLVLGVLGVATLLMRLRWAESPKWLYDKGREAEAQKAMKVFYGADATFEPELETTESAPGKPVPFADMFRGENLSRVIFSGIPWACEGLGVYGFGVFLPTLVMALGLDVGRGGGVGGIMGSVEMTAVVNFFILPGFIIGLLMMHKVNHVWMLSWGFVLSAVGLLTLYLGYVLHLPKLVMILGFVIFEVALNGGPHLITFVIPSMIYPVAIRGTGSGIAAFLGKVGAIVGVVIMPFLLSAGGASLVLLVSIAVMFAGAVISVIYGKKVVQYSTK